MPIIGVLSTLRRFCRTLSTPCRFLRQRLSHYTQAADLRHCSIHLLEELPVRFNTSVNEPCRCIASCRANAGLDQCIYSIQVATINTACYNIALGCGLLSCLPATSQGNCLKGLSTHFLQRRSECSHKPCCNTLSFPCKTQQQVFRCNFLLMKMSCLVKSQSSRSHSSWSKANLSNHCFLTLLDNKCYSSANCLKFNSQAM